MFSAAGSIDVSQTLTQSQLYPWNARPLQRSRLDHQECWRCSGKRRSQGLTRTPKELFSVPENGFLAWQRDHSINHMKNHVPPAAIPICLFAMTLIVRGQDAGIGTFNDLVGQALESAPTPKPEEETISTAGFNGKTTTSTTTAAATFNYQPGLEYDYRFNQQETGDHFSTDIN